MFGHRGGRHGAGLMRGEGGALQHALLHQKLDPQHVAVARQQRVVQIKQREFQTALRCHAFGRVKVSMP